MASNDFEANGPGRASLGFHGGNLAAAGSCFPDAPLPWLDLSTGINALSYPMPTLSANAWQRLPEAADIARLEQVAARCYGAGDPESVVAAPGTQALIQLLPHIVPGTTVGIFGFTYAEHARAWQAAGAAVALVDLGAAAQRFDVIVVVNPNNPDGRLLDAAALLALAQRCTTLVVDEAFMDVMPSGHSLIPHLPHSGAIVLRSFGKTFGLAGLRLGFAVASPDLAERLRRRLGPWAISGPAIETGALALADNAWLAKATSGLRQAAHRLDGLLQAAGCGIAGGTPLFRLASHARAPEIFVRLASAGVLVRPFADKPEWLRFGLPMREADWARLAAALDGISQIRASLAPAIDRGDETKGLGH